MAKVTPKENFMKLRHGGTPDYVPFYSLMGAPYKGESACGGIRLPFFTSTQFVDGGKDIWGVPYKAPESGVQATMPDTSFVMLEDIADWTKVVKFPTPNDVDVEKVYQDALKTFDRSQTALKIGFDFSPFQELVAMMGFDGGLMALYTDPEEVKAMFMAMVDYLEPYYTRLIDEFKPDLWYMLDDTCAKETPFFSPAIYEEVFLPVYRRLAKPANDRGIPIVFHNCGKVDEFIPFMLDFGVKILEPMQETNDIPSLTEQYKGKLGLVGGWDWGVRIPKNYPEYDEEEFRQGVRDVIDYDAPGGAYGFLGWPISYPGDPVCAEITRIMRDEAHWYGRKVYGYTGD